MVQRRIQQINAKFNRTITWAIVVALASVNSPASVLLAVVPAAPSPHIGNDLEHLEHPTCCGKIETNFQPPHTESGSTSTARGEERDHPETMRGGSGRRRRGSDE